MSEGGGGAIPMSEGGGGAIPMSEGGGGAIPMSEGGRERSYYSSEENLLDPKWKEF
jgi:hypothetical protein